MPLVRVKATRRIHISLLPYSNDGWVTKEAGFRQAKMDVQQRRALLNAEAYASILRALFAKSTNDSVRGALALPSGLPLGLCCSLQNCA